MGTTESLLYPVVEEQQQQQQQPPRPDDPQRGRPPRRRSVIPTPPASSSSTRQKHHPRNDDDDGATLVLSCRILGLPGVGKRTLLQRLQGKSIGVGGTTDTDTIETASVTVPFRPPPDCPCWHDRIQWCVTVDGHGDAGASRDAVILLLVDPRARRSTTKHYVQQVIQQQQQQQNVPICILRNFHDDDTADASSRRRRFVSLEQLHAWVDVVSQQSQLLLLRIHDTSLVTCYGLTDVHWFLYHAYVVKGRIEPLEADVQAAWSIVVGKKEKKEKGTTEHATSEQAPTTMTTTTTKTSSSSSSSSYGDDDEEEDGTTTFTTEKDMTTLEAFLESDDEDEDPAAAGGVMVPPPPPPPSEEDTDAVYIQEETTDAPDLNVVSGQQDPTKRETALYEGHAADARAEDVTPSAAEATEAEPDSITMDADDTGACSVPDSPSEPAVVGDENSAGTAQDTESPQEDPAAAAATSNESASATVDSDPSEESGANDKDDSPFVPEEEQRSASVANGDAAPSSIDSEKPTTLPREGESDPKQQPMASSEFEEKQPADTKHDDDRSSDVAPISTQPTAIRTSTDDDDDSEDEDEFFIDEGATEYVRPFEDQPQSEGSPHEPAGGTTPTDTSPHTEENVDSDDDTVDEIRQALKAATKDFEKMLRSGREEHSNTPEEEEASPRKSKKTKKDKKKKKKKSERKEPKDS